MSHLIPGDELANHVIADSPWLLKPYLPREGIVFLYGKKGVGKSPLTWTLARSIATGEPFFGCQPQGKGRVLYIEVDSPLSLVAGRFEGKTPLPPEVCFYFPSNPVIISKDGRRQLGQDLREYLKGQKPELVIINTLRKIHVLKDTESATVSFVYSQLRTLFPGSCLLIVHHEKKTPANPEHSFEKGEEFSGSLAWHNDANVCLNLRRAAGLHAKEGMNLSLEMTGNQLGAHADDLLLNLAPDGFTLRPRLTSKDSKPIKQGF